MARLCGKDGRTLYLHIVIEFSQSPFHQSLLTESEELGELKVIEGDLSKTNHRAKKPRNDISIRMGRVDGW